MVRRTRMNRRMSLATTGNSRRLKRGVSPPVMWNIQGMRGKMSSNCLWHACEALFVGILLFSIGASMSVMGFHADGFLDPKINRTERNFRYDETRIPTVRFSKLSYAGPIVMGIGGFIIVATCVLTFEARDSAAKVGPAALIATRSTSSTIFVPPPRLRTRSLDVRSVASQTDEFTSSSSLHNNHLFDRKHIMETFRRFSKTIRKNSREDDAEEFPRSPSAPDLQDLDSPQTPQASLKSILNLKNTPYGGPRSGRRTSHCPYIPPKKSNRLPLSIIRQSMSVESSNYSPFLLHAVPSSSKGSLQETTGSSLMIELERERKLPGRVGQRRNSAFASFPSFPMKKNESSPPSSLVNSTIKMHQQHKGGGNLGNPGTVDLHLPNGVVTLNVVSSTPSPMRSPRSPLLPSYFEEEIEMESRPSTSKAASSSHPLQIIMEREVSIAGGRPALLRQTGLDSEIISMPDFVPDEGPRQSVIIEEETEESEYL